MPKVRIQAHELTDVTPTHVSLVKRGATRAPWKIIKSEAPATEEGHKPMLNWDLKNLFKAEPQAPAVAAILVNKASDMDAVKARIAKAGFQSDTSFDGSSDILVFPQLDPMPENLTVIKMDESLGVAVSHIAKAFEGVNLESIDFDKVMAQEGLRPGVSLALDMLHNTLSNVFAKAETKEDLANGIRQAIDAFGTHVNALASAVPSDAFTMDFSPDVMKGAGGMKGKKKRKDDEGEEDKPAAEAKPAEEKPEEKPKETGTEGEENKEKPAVAKAGDQPEAEALGKLLAPLMEQLGAVGETMKELQTGFTKQQTGLDKLSDRMGQVESVAKSAREAVESAVGGEPERDTGTAARKEAPNGSIGLIDTAFMTPEERKAL